MALPASSSGNLVEGSRGSPEGRVRVPVNATPLVPACLPADLAKLAGPKSRSHPGAEKSVRLAVSMLIKTVLQVGCRAGCRGPGVQGEVAQSQHERLAPTPLGQPPTTPTQPFPTPPPLAVH